jgi:hypothetical protein
MSFKKLADQNESTKATTKDEENEFFYDNNEGDEEAMNSTKLYKGKEQDARPVAANDDAERLSKQRAEEQEAIQCKKDHEAEEDALTRSKTHYDNAMSAVDTATEKVAHAPTSKTQPDKTQSEDWSDSEEQAEIPVDKHNAMMYRLVSLKKGMKETAKAIRALSGTSSKDELVVVLSTISTQREELIALMGDLEDVSPDGPSVKAMKKALMHMDQAIEGLAGFAKTLDPKPVNDLVKSPKA